MPCKAFVDGLSVAVDDRTSFEPDALELLRKKKNRRLLQLLAPDARVDRRLLLRAGRLTDHD